MMGALVRQSLRTGRVRMLCAVLGVATAVGSLFFVDSLTTTHRMQAPLLAHYACAPYRAWVQDAEPALRGNLTLTNCALSIDFRPNGRVLQGPPVRAVMTCAPATNPYAHLALTPGSQWVHASTSMPEIVCSKSLFKRFGPHALPPLGEMLRLVGEKGTLAARLVGYFEESPLPRGWPTLFANEAACAGLTGETVHTLTLFEEVPSHAPPHLLTCDSPAAYAPFVHDEARRMNNVQPLLFGAVLLTALCLLMHAMFLSIEANRNTLSTLRLIGLTRGGVVRFVLCEALVEALIGYGVGLLVAGLLLKGWTLWQPSSFPMGVIGSVRMALYTLLGTLVVTMLASFCALKRMLSVGALESVSSASPRPSRGLTISFACAFAAFVAVEVWGASLMHSFVPSPTWPDAIVSILPEGVSAFDIEKVRHVSGVKRLSELAVSQVFLPTQEGQKRPSNVLLLASSWFPSFPLLPSSPTNAPACMLAGEGCILSEMVARAHHLKEGDSLTVQVGRGARSTSLSIPILGIVQVNWHLVTSRALVRGLNRMPPMTDGPVFVSFDWLESTHMLPAPFVPMTHLCLDYEDDFLHRWGVFEAGRRVEKEIAHALHLDATHTHNTSTVRLHARDEIADGTLAHGDDLIGEAARIPSIFLAILSIGFIALLVAEADRTRADLALLRALGQTRWALTCHLVRVALKMALVGIVLGLPLGALVGWLVALRTASIWPGMPISFVLPVRPLVEGTLGALVCVCAFTLPTAHRLISRAFQSGEGFSC